MLVIIGERSLDVRAVPGAACHSHAGLKQTAPGPGLIARKGTAMNERRWWFWGLTASGLLQCGVAIAHFGLQYEWRGVDGGSLPVQLRWALFALNFSWSMLVLGVGVLMCLAGRLHPHVAFVRAAVIAVGLFWTIHGIYMVVMPMPVPARLAWTQGPIVAFPVIVVALQWLPIVATRLSAQGDPRLTAPVDGP